MIALTLVNFCMFWDMVFFSKQGLWECVFFCTCFLLKHHFSCQIKSTYVCVYIYIIVFIGNIIEHNRFFQSCLHFALLLSNPNRKKTTHKTYISTNHESPLACFFFGRFVCFGFGFQSRRAKCRPHWTTLCVVPMCLKFLPDISSMNYLANKNQLYHGGGPTSTQPHLWISSKCACSVDFFMVWVPWQTGIENHGRKMHHSHDLNISTSLSASTLFVFFVGFARPGRLHFIPQKGRANPTKKC